MRTEATRAARAMAVFCALAGGAGAQTGQPCRIPAFDDCSTLGVMSTNPANQWRLLYPDWDIDRRPVGVIQMYNGCFYDNPRGAPDGFWYDYDDEPGHYSSTSYPFDPARDGAGSVIVVNGHAMPRVIKQMLDRMDAMADNGWKRIILYMPAGGPYLQSPAVSSSQYWTLADWKRDAMNYFIPWWLDQHDPDISLGVYTGWKIDDPCSLCHSDNGYDHVERGPWTGTGTPCGGLNPYYFPCDGANPPPTVSPDPKDADDACTFHLNVEPWLRMGMKEVWFDAASEHYQTTAVDFMNFARSPNYSGRMKAGGEAIPINPVGGEHYDPDLLDDAPWVATRQFIDHYNDTPVDPGTTEVGYWPTNGTPGAQEFHDRVGDGYVLWLSLPNASWERAYQRIYSFGTIDVADFNGDGAVTGTDYTDFLLAFNGTHNPGQGYNFRSGDVNEDHVVNSSDYYDFITAYFNGTGVRVFGGPYPEYAAP